MKTRLRIFPLTLAMTAWACLPAATGLFGALTYDASLKDGDAFRKAKEYDKALLEYESAVTLGTTDTERALALAKQGVIYAFDKIDYAKAKELAKQALDSGQPKPVAMVIAYQVLAQCQSKGSNDYTAAAATLEKAIQLAGVEWAIPGLNLSLGDCYRNTGEFEKALEAYQRVLDIKTITDEVRSIGLLNTGLTHQYNLHDFDKAKASYEEAVKLNSKLQKEVDQHLANMKSKAFP